MSDADLSNTGSSDPSSTELVARDAGSTTLAHLVGVALRYAAALFTTRILGAAAFGSFTLAHTVVVMLSRVSIVGLSPGVLPFLAKTGRAGDEPGSRAVVRSSWLIVAACSGVLAILAWSLAPWLASRVFEDETLTGILRPLSILVAVTALTTVSLAIAQAFGAVREQAWIERVAVLAVTVVGLAATWWWELGMTGVVFATLAGPLLGLLLGIGLTARLVPGAVKRGAACSALPVGPLLASSWPLMGVSVLSVIVLWMDVVLMGVFREPYEVGVYGACARLAPTILLVQEGVVPVFSRRLSELHVDGNWSGIRRLYQLTARWSVWWALVMGWIFLLWGREILALFGEEFVVGSVVLSVLCLARIMGVAAGMSTRLLMLTGKGRTTLWNAVLLVACNIAFDLIWIPRYGAIGAAWATCLALSVGAIHRVVLVWRCYHILPWTRHTLLAIGATGLAAGLCYFWRAGPDWTFGWLVPLTTFVLVCALVYRLWGMEAEDRHALAALRSRFRK